MCADVSKIPVFPLISTVHVPSAGERYGFTNYAQGRLWGTIAALVLAVGWSATAFLSIRRMRRGRLTWWLPIVGALVTTIIASICVAIPMMGDPAFVSFLTSSALQ